VGIILDLQSTQKRTRQEDYQVNTPDEDAQVCFQTP